MSITFQQLRVLRTVVVHGRVNLAASALGVSQPSVSQQLRRLEEELGFALLELRDGRLVPTDRGGQVHQIAEMVESATDRLRELSAEARLGTHSSLTIGANTTGGMYLAPELMRAFHREQLDVGLKLLIGNVNALAAAVVGGVCDLAVVGGPITSREFATATFFTDTLPLVVAPSDPFASRRVVSLGDLRSRLFVLPGLGSRTRLVVETALRGVGVELERVTEYPDTEAVKKAVEAGLGVGYLSREGVRRELRHGYLVEVFVEGLVIERPFQAFWLKERTVPGLVASFIESAQRQIALRDAEEGGRRPQAKPHAGPARGA